MGDFIVHAQLWSSDFLDGGQLAIIFFIDTLSQSALSSVTNIHDM